MQKMLGRAASLILAAIIALVLALVFSWLKFVHTPFKKTTTIELAQGASLKSLARMLSQKGLIEHPWYFEALGRAMGVSADLKAGQYAITPEMTSGILLAHIVSGDVVEYDFTIVEGWTFQTLKTALEHDVNLVNNLHGQSNAAIMKKLGSAYAHPEGLFFPDTYQFHWGETDFDILKRSYDKMQQVLLKQWPARAPHLPYRDAYQALTMASIIEKETALDSERSRISGVLVRRLKKVMHLGVDPSVVYGLSKQYGYRLTRADLRKKTPYNTYVNYGLPPTPIDMPSLASIIAALHPDHGTSMYYVSKNDGSHVFSVTYKQHLRAVNKWQRGK